MFHVHGLTNLFLSSANEWIAKQYFVCALVELRDEGLQEGLDTRQCMQTVKVNLLNTQTSWSTQVAIAGRKRAIDLDISALPPSEVAENFLMHLQDSPAAPDKSATDQIHRTIPKAASGSAWIPPQVPDDKPQVCCILE